MIRNGDVSFVFISEQDGTIPPVPAENRRGEPEDFSASAALEGADDAVLLVVALALSRHPTSSRGDLA